MSRRIHNNGIRIGGRRMRTVRCALCGYIGKVNLHYDWHKGRYGKCPDVYICDIHQLEMERGLIAA